MFGNCPRMFTAVATNKEAIVVSVKLPPRREFKIRIDSSFLLGVEYARIVSLV